MLGSVPTAMHACNGSGAFIEVKAPIHFREHTLAG
jgi:hypothetical protein